MDQRSQRFLGPLFWTSSRTGIMLPPSPFLPVGGMGVPLDWISQCFLGPDDSGRTVEMDVSSGLLFQMGPGILMLPRFCFFRRDRVFGCFLPYDVVTVPYFKRGVGDSYSFFNRRTPLQAAKLRVPIAFHSDLVFGQGRRGTMRTVS